MSQVHDSAFESIRYEYDSVVSGLGLLSKSSAKGIPGNPAYSRDQVEAAIATSGDAYALLLVATAEGFLRDFLESQGIAIGDEPKLSSLVDQTTKQFCVGLVSSQKRAQRKAIGVGEMHSLRTNRNDYAHGHGRNLFPTVPRVQAILSRFCRPIP